MDYRRQQGFLMMVAIVLIVIVGFLGIAMAQVFFATAFSVTNATQGTKALYLAQAACEVGTRKLSTPDLSNRTACLNLSLTGTLNNNAYKVSGVPYYTSSPTTLSSALTASTRTISVSSTANYRPTGRIMIDSEVMSYQSKSDTAFLDVVRGVDGTSAVAHATNTRVGQYQCELTNEGGVPSLTLPSNPGDPGGYRSFTETVQLPEGWAVGNAVGGNSTFIRWNNPTELAWNNASQSGAINLASVSMSSYVDGWAVGNSNFFGRWNGSTWAGVATGLPGTQYNDVYCVSGNSCHAVGASRNIAYWNGTSWANMTASGSTTNTNILAVHCDNANNCWAVGSNTGGGRFYNGVGTPPSWTGFNVNTLSAFPYNDVFCNSANDCWAVGASGTFARKSGASWANLVTGLPAVQYNGIYCTSSTNCWAVGNASGGRDTIALWNGTGWSRNAANPTPVANLTTVRCSHPSNCWAAGVTTTGTTPVFVHWDGTTWSSFSTSGLPATGITKISFIGPLSNPLSAWRPTQN